MKYTLRKLGKYLLQYLKITSKSALFFSACMSFLVGVFLQNILLDALLALVFGGLFFLLGCNYSIYKKTLSSLIFSILSFLVGVYISSVSTVHITQNHLYLEPYYLETQPSIVYEITEEYRQNDFDRDYVFHLQNLSGVDVGEKEIYGIVRVPYNYDLQIGSLIKSEAKLYKILNFSSGNIQDYYLSKSIYFRIYPYDIQTVGVLPPSNIKLFRNSFLSSIHELFPPPTSSLLGGVLLGERASLSKDLRDNFNRSGLSHIIAVSGFNITILVLFCSYLFFLFPRVIKVIALLFIVVLFVLLVGVSAPVVRAAIMGVVGYIILSSGRKVDSVLLLLFSLCAIVLFSPYSLNYDISLHLSFFAVLGIVLFSDLFTKMLFFVPKTFFIRESLVMTLGALVLNIPIVFTSFGQLSLVAPISNILVVWNLPFVMLFGFLAIIFSYFFSLGAVIFSYITYLFLSFDISMVNYFGSREWAVWQVSLGEWGWYFTGGYYVALYLISRLLR